VVDSHATSNPAISDEKNGIKLRVSFAGFYLFKQDEFGANCAVDKHTKISVEIRILADI